MTSATGGGQDWFYHASKPKSETPVDAPAPSQIPGLDGVSPDSDDETIASSEGLPHERRIFEWDSKYVRLAKAGGRKNLLTYQEPKSQSSEPVSYPWPDWVDYRQTDDIPEEQEFLPAYKPDWAVHIEHKPSDEEVAGRFVKAPFEWTSKEPKNIKLPAAAHKKRKQKVLSAKPKVDSWSPVKSKAAKTQLPKHEPGEPVSINRIMTMDYKREWFQARDRQKAEKRDEARTVLAYKKDLTQRHMMANLKEGKKLDDTKNRFTLNRFKNVPSKIGYIWSPDQAGVSDNLEASS
eukprot:m.309243 g.309243  ORF g.309243 m.309243 type:complete len:292 (+) comp45872_c0_seq1:55-930(+)